MAGQVSVLRHAQELTSRVQDGVEGSVHDTLRSDVHPASGCHLSIGGAAHSCGLCPVLRVIEHAHHQAVGHDDTGAGLVGFEQAHGMAAHHHQGVLVCELLQVSLDQLVLHPVLADLAGLSVCNKLIWVQGHIMVQVVVDHDLECFSFHTVSFIFIDRSSVDPVLRHKTVSVDTSSCQKFV